MYKLISVTVYLLSFVLSFYALSSVKFENFCVVNNPRKVQLLLLALSLALAYPIAQFILLFIL